MTCKFRTGQKTFFSFRRDLTDFLSPRRTRFELCLRSFLVFALALGISPNNKRSRCTRHILEYDEASVNTITNYSVGGLFI